MMQITVEKMPVYGYHGCLVEEGLIGTQYEVDVIMDYDFEESAIHDDLSKTIDYVKVYEIVKEEMAIRSKLIEQVARRIYLSVLAHYPGITKCVVAITKHNPPVNGNMPFAKVVYTK